MFGIRKGKDVANMITMQVLIEKTIRNEKEIEIIKINADMEMYGIRFELDGDYIKIYKDDEFFSAFDSIQKLRTRCAGYKEGFGDIEIAINCDICDDCVDNGCVDSCDEECNYDDCIKEDCNNIIQQHIID